MAADAPLGCPCAGRHMSVAWTYTAPPEGETRFAALEGVAYRREVRRCDACDHFTSRPPLDPDDLYREGYVDATYGQGGIEASFRRIMELPPERSDNRQRVERVLRFMDRRPDAERRALDIGSGLGVFPAALAGRGWRCRAVDPDPRAAAHADGLEGVEGVCADVMDLAPRADHALVSLNKVIEHVDDPVALMARGAGFLAPGGTMYVEVPDGPGAASDGPGREEFFVEHLHVFSAASLAMAARRAGLDTVEVHRLREPSGKHTIAAFLEPVGGDA